MAEHRNVDSELLPGNFDLVETIVESAAAAIAEIGDVPDRLRWLNEGMLDPNDWRTVSETPSALDTFHSPRAITFEWALANVY